MAYRGNVLGYTTQTAPTNGLIVSGNTSIGTSSNVNKLDISGAIAIGTYAGANTAPSNGLIVSGSVGFGTNSLLASADFNYTGNNTYIYLFRGTNNVSGSPSYGLYSSISLFVTNSFANVHQIGVSSILTIAPLITVTNSAAINIDAGNQAGSGSVTNAYGLYASNPGYGSNRSAIYGDNIAIGYTGISPPANGAAISGNTTIGSSSATALFNVGSSNQFQVNSSGVASAPQYDLRGSSSGTISILPQAAAGTFNFNLPTTAGSSGQLLTSGGGFGSPMTWSTIGSIAVTSLTGTANQVLVNATSGSAQTGVCTVAFPATAGISIGSYQPTVAPIGGIIAPGQIAFGTNSATAGYQVTISSTLAQGIGVFGTSVSSTNQFSYYTNQTFSNSGIAGYAFAYADNGIYAATSTNTIAHAGGFYSSPQFTGNAGAITEAYGFYCDGGGSTVGTITRGFGGYFLTPNFGTTKIALFCSNACVGTTSAPPSGGMLINGNTSIGTNSNLNKLDISGGIAIGTYAAVNTAPTNGIIVSGNGSIGSPNSNPTSIRNVRLYVATGNINIDNGYQLSLRSDLGTEASGGYWLGYNSSGTFSLATCINVSNDPSTARSVLFTTSSNEAITGTLTAGMAVYPVKGAVSIGTTYSTNRGPDNSLIVEGNVSIGSTSNTYKLEVTSGDIAIQTIGNTYRVKTGSNARAGTAVLVAGTATVTTTAVGANSMILVGQNVPGGTPGALYVSAKTNGTSFVITSTNALDTSTAAWIIFEPS